MKKNIFSILFTLVSVPFFLNIMSCQIDAGGDDNSNTLPAFVFSKTGDDSPTGYIKIGEHDKNYFKATGYTNKKNGIGFDSTDLLNESTIRVVKIEELPVSIEITDAKPYNFRHGLTYKIECKLQNYSNSATMTVKAINQYDMYGETSVKQTLVKGLVYPYHQLYGSFTNADCSFNTNQMKYLDENLNSQFTMFYGPNSLSCTNKVSDIRNLKITEDMKCIMIYGKGNLSAPTDEYLPIVITNTIEEKSDSLSLAVMNYYDDDGKQHKFENQKKGVTATNFGANLFMQVQNELNNCGYVKLTDSSGKLCSGITLKIHESNYSGNWKSSDIVSTVTSSSSWTPSSNGTYYIEVNCQIDGQDFSNGYSTANAIKVTLE